jgi:hypothetical protein
MPRSTAIGYIALPFSRRPFRMQDATQIDMTSSTVIRDNLRDQVGRLELRLSIYQRTKLERIISQSFTEAQ